MGDGFAVDPGALGETAQSITEVIAELKMLGINESPELGRGRSGRSLREMQLGHEGLQGAFDQFCERWSWGVRTLVADSNQIAAWLKCSADLYQDMDNYAVGVFTDLIGPKRGDGG